MLMSKQNPKADANPEYEEEMRQLRAEIDKMRDEDLLQLVKTGNVSGLAYFV